MDGVGYDDYVQNRCCNITNCCESPVKREKRTESQTHNTDMSNQGYLMVRFATDCWPVHIQVDIWVIYINRGQALLIFYIWQASPVAGNKVPSCAEDFSPEVSQKGNGTTRQCWHGQDELFLTPIPAGLSLFLWSGPFFFFKSLTPSRDTSESTKLLTTINFKAVNVH